MKDVQIKSLFRESEKYADSDLRGTALANALYGELPGLENLLSDDTNTKDVVETTVKGKLDSIDVSGLKKLTNVSAYNQALTSVNVKDCAALKSITFGSISGWKADKVSISSDVLSNNSSAAMYLAILHSDKVWKRA